MVPDRSSRLVQTDPMKFRITSYNVCYTKLLRPGVEGDIIEIYQDFENDIYLALKEGLNKIKKYNKLRNNFV